MREPQAFRRSVDAPRRKPALPLAEIKLRPFAEESCIRRYAPPYPSRDCHYEQSEESRLERQTFRFAQDDKRQFRNSLHQKGMVRLGTPPVQVI